jgi:ferredoxin
MEMFMPSKYHVPFKTAPPRYQPVGKYSTVEFREDCAGSCRACVKKYCVYGIFKENYLHVSSMKEPEYLYTCQSCFRCVQECTKGIFSRVINPEYRALGDDYWRADIIHRTWYQAHTGKVPVSGAGYRGPFVGDGFDAIWTDMSEIVRPTRDGIHGREYINTSIELSRRVTRLKFLQDLSLESNVPPILEVPLPALFRQPGFGILSENVLLAAAKAAHVLGTMMFIQPDQYTEVFTPYADSLIPCLTMDDLANHQELLQRSRMIELVYEPSIAGEIPNLRKKYKGLMVCVGVPLTAEAASRALALAQADTDAVHFHADERGNELHAEKPRFLKEMIREVHLNLVEHSLRQGINLIFSGGIAMAEHMAKAIICGADGVAVDNALLVALECRLCHRCVEGKSCPARLEEVELEWGSQRIVNLIGAWRNQLLEVMGAMGIRETRRMRGEVGRSMWFEDLERESFGPIFGNKEVSGLG